MMKSQQSDTKKIIRLRKVKEKALMKLLDKMHKYKIKQCYLIVKNKKKYRKHKSKSFKD